MKKKLSLTILTVGLAFALPMVSCSSAESSANSVATGHPSGVRVSCIDVGKGDCILVQSGVSSALIDVGYKNTANEVLSYLQKQGVTKVDALILTHYDRDHVGGLRPVAKALGVDKVYLPGYKGADKNYEETMKTVADLGISAQPITQELNLDLDKAKLTVYPSEVTFVPGVKGDEGNDNDVSLVAALSYGKDSYLFAGDLEEEGIDAYLRGNHGRFDVVKMPHHGAKGDNTEDFLDDVQPKIALVTDSVDESAGKKTLKLLDKQCKDVYRTSVDGTIVVESDGAGNYTVATGA